MMIAIVETTLMTTVAVQDVRLELERGRKCLAYLKPKVVFSVAVLNPPPQTQAVTPIISKGERTPQKSNATT
jgi:hypothetical protein